MKIPAYLLEVLKALKDWQYEAVWARSPTVYSEPRLILDIETKEDCETKRAVRKIEAERNRIAYRDGGTDHEHRGHWAVRRVRPWSR